MSVCGRGGKTRHDKLCGKRNGCNAGVGGIKAVLLQIGELKKRGRRDDIYSERGLNIAV